MNKIFAVPFALALTVPAVLVTTTAAESQERVGTSRADLPSYKGAFSINNQTGVTLHYQVKWGEKNAWKSIEVRNGAHGDSQLSAGKRQGPHALCPLRQGRRR